MNQNTLIEEVEYLLFKYLEEGVATKTFSEFVKAIREKRNIGKEVLHVLSSQKISDFEDSDRNRVKAVAHNLGL